MKKLLIFDYDGVIADSLNVLWKCFKQVNKKYKFFNFRNRKEFTKLWDTNIYECASRFGISDEEFMKFSREWRNLSILENNKVKLFSGLKPVLKKLSDTNSLIIISSNDEEVMNDFLRRNSILDYFDSILGKESGLSKKKKVKHVCKFFNEDETYYITDTIGDIKELKKLNLKIIAATWGFHDEKKLKKEKPDFIVKNPKELLNLLM